MINDELIAYIQSQKRKNISEDIIRTRLSGAGWHIGDIEEAFRKIEPPVIVARTPIPVVAETPVVGLSNTLNTDPTPSIQKEIVTPISSVPKAEEPKVWIPTAAKPAAAVSLDEINPSADQPVVLVSPDPLPEPKPVRYVIPQETPVVELPITVQLPVEKPIVQEVHVPEEFIPTLIPKAPQSQAATPTPVVRQIGQDMTLAKSALLSSYQQDISDAVIITEDRPFFQRRKSKIAMAVIVIALLVGGAVYALMEGYINISSWIKKDPKNLLLQQAAAFSSSEGYKTKTDATLSFPVFSSITTGLTSGETVTSNEMDSISLQTKGRVNRDLRGVTFEYGGIITSSLYPQDIPVDVKYDGAMLYTTIPDLTSTFGVNAPTESVVSITENQLPLILSELPTNLTQRAKDVNLYKILSTQARLSADPLSSVSFAEFVKNTTITEKGTENIDGVLSYHYELSADRASMKKFLTDFVSLFTVGLSGKAQANLEESIGSVTLDTFDVWVGKETNSIVGYRIALSLPLSKVIGLDDKGIAGSKVHIDWKTTYSDFNVANTITMPKNAMSPDEYVKRIHDMKIKDAVTNFKSQALSLRNAIGGYGKTSNKAGSCLNPLPGSLYSPVGHSKVASTQVAGIADTMNTLLASTNSTGLCFSTPTAWAFSFPLATNNQVFYCADSAGAVLTTATSLTDTVCR